MAIKCAGCKGYHDSIAEVRECQNAPAAAANQHRPQSQNGQKNPLSPKQVTMAEKIIAKLGAEYTGETPIAELPRWGEGRTLVEALLKAEQQWAHGQPYRLPDGVSQSARPRGASPASSPRDNTPLPDVPEGHYAVPSLTGNNDYDFFRVDRPQEGTWAGKTFVKRVIGGKPDTNIRASTRRKALEAIVEYGIPKSRWEYGQQVGQCFKCNRHLTKYASRKLSCGRTCSGHVGLGEKWDRIQSKYEAKHGKE